MDIKNQKLNSH